MMTEGNGPDFKPARPKVLIRRVRIRNFRSIAYCEVELRPLTVFVGRNGSGKSNFLDALAFVREALRDSFARAFGERGGFRNVRFAGADEGEPIGIRLDFEFSDGRSGHYELSLRDPQTREDALDEESLHIEGAQGPLLSYRVRDGKLEDWSPSKETSETPVHDWDTSQIARFTRENMPPVTTERPYLANISVVPQAADIFAALQGYALYRFDPERMRSPYRGTDDNVLYGDRRNLAAAFDRIAERSGAVEERIVAYLKCIIPGLESVRSCWDRSSDRDSGLSSLILEQTIAGRSVEFNAFDWSDGTLRALAALVAVWQLPKWGPPIRLVAIEEPETSLHPAASGALMDAFHEAAVQRQVLITTHSPDLLDRVEFEEDQVLAFEASGQGTVISPIDGASRQAIRDHLYSPGELLRMDQIETDWRDLERQRQALGLPATADS